MASFDHFYDPTLPAMDFSLEDFDLFADCGLYTNFVDEPIPDDTILRLECAEIDKIIAEAQANTSSDEFSTSIDQPYISPLADNPNAVDILPSIEKVPQQMLLSPTSASSTVAPSAFFSDTTSTPSEYCGSEFDQNTQRRSFSLPPGGLNCTLSKPQSSRRPIRRQPCPYIEPTSPRPRSETHPQIPQTPSPRRYRSHPYSPRRQRRHDSPRANSYNALPISDSSKLLTPPVSAIADKFASQQNPESLALLLTSQMAHIFAQPQPHRPSRIDMLSEALENIETADMIAETAPHDLSEMLTAVLDFLERQSDGLLVLREHLKKGLVALKDPTAVELERRRNEARAENTTITSIHDHLHQLPILTRRYSGDRYNNIDCFGDWEPFEIPLAPLTAIQIRNMNAGEITTLLDVYEIPYSSNMFTPAKKELYMKFIGANRRLMEKVLE